MQDIQTSFVGNKIDSPCKGIEIYKVDPNNLTTIKANERSLHKGFFINSEIYGSLYETNKVDYFLLAIKKGLYCIYCPHFYILVLQNYIFSLKNDITRFNMFNTSQGIYSSSQVLKNYTKQIDVFEEQCEGFIEKYPIKQLEDYDYIHNLKYLIASYGSIRTTLLGNAESLYDSSNSNNFLLLGVNNLNLSSYARVKSWIIENQEHYIHNILNLPQKNEYEISLTSSGMKAIGLVIQFLISQGKKKVMIIGVIYFETIKLLEDYFGLDNIIFYDSSKGFDNFKKELLIHNPDAIFADAATLEFESHGINKEIFSFMTQTAHEFNPDIHIIADVSTKYTQLEDFKIPRNSIDTVFFVSSLGKYLYGGMDLGFGGYILAPKKCVEIQQMFSNSGAGISNSDALKIPFFTTENHNNIRNILNKKIGEIEQKWINTDFPFTNISCNFPFKDINNKSNNFFGNLINIGYTVENIKSNMISEHKVLIVQKIISAARKHNIPMSYSTSYGYYNTRVSVFMCETIKAAPIIHPCYIRISVGYTSQVEDVIKLINIIGIILHQLESK